LLGGFVMREIRRRIGWFFFRIKYALGLAKDGVDFIQAPYGFYDPEVLKKFGIDPDGQIKKP